MTPYWDYVFMTGFRIRAAALGGRSPSGRASTESQAEVLLAAAVALDNGPVIDLVGDDPQITMAEWRPSVHPVDTHAFLADGDGTLVSQNGSYVRVAR